MAENAWTIDAQTGSTSSRVYFPHAKYIGGHGHKVCAYKRQCISIDKLMIRAIMLRRSCRSYKILHMINAVNASTSLDIRCSSN